MFRLIKLQAKYVFLPALIINLEKQRQLKYAAFKISIYCRVSQAHPMKFLNNCINVGQSVILVI